MKTLLASLCLLACASLSAKDLGMNPLFKHYIGTWKAAGELKGENNNTLDIKEEWTGSADGDNSFVIRGTRTINGDTQPFQWTITYNEGADSYEANLTGADGSQNIHFEGHVSEVNLTFELKAITGSGQSSITITEAFAGTGEAKDVIESKVTFTGDAGQTTLEGVIKHEKEKQP
ncbi:hypothetical protein [Prosthecobacter vanneervenii]|uniref:DUF1579 domain-containing protein n=1 Tax=Prosthecobacter vanneervenii TaxID=48466 RepID=A0A7W7YEQ7_9BACT|nr:hypothetical protein [Prosthecobacter vanneervenii]MBB5034808.1 hypothetical protein [Prosthecobacter vanneervenii]